MRVEAYGCSPRKETKFFFVPIPDLFLLVFFLMSSFKILIRPPESDPNTVIDKFIKDFKKSKFSVWFVSLEQFSDDLPVFQPMRGKTKNCRKYLRDCDCYG